MKSQIKNCEGKLSALASRVTVPHLIIIIFLVSFAVYFNSLFNGFVYDDTQQIMENRWIRDARFIPDILISGVWSFKSATEGSNYYRPMMYVIYMLNYYIFGLKPWGFHLINIFFHASVSVLVFIIARKLLAQSHPSELPTVLPAFLASLLFATHPIHTEAVTWVAGVPDLSYAFFFLLSFYLYMKSKEGIKGMYFLSILSFSIATLCKEPALTLPFILVAYDFAFHRPLLSASSPNTSYNLSAIGSFLRRYIPYFVVAGVYLMLRFHALGEFSPPKLHVKLTTYGDIINVFPLFAGYLEKILLPLNLNAFHVLHPIFSVFELKGILSLIITAAFVALSIIALKKNSMAFISLVMIALPLLPSLYIPAVGENVLAERYLYLPSFGFVLLIAFSISWTKSYRPRLASGLVVVSFIVAVAYSIDAVNRNAVWRDDLSLFTDTVKKSPDAAPPHNNLGIAYVSQNRLDEAIIEFKSALSLNPDYADAYYDLGTAYAKQNRLDEAIIEFKAALMLKPDFAKARNNLGAAYIRQNRFDEAINELVNALTLKPDYAEAHNNLGIVYEKQRRFDEAIIEYKKAIMIEPDYAEAHKNLGAIYHDRGWIEKAIEQYQISLKLRSDDVTTYNDLGNAYDDKGLPDRAIEYYQIALRLKPDDALTHFNLGITYEKKGLKSQAKKEFQMALEINPDFTAARRTLESIAN